MNNPSTGYCPGPYDLLFTRTAADGSDERIVLVGNLCRNAECDCRDVIYYGYLLPGTGTEDLPGRDLGERVLDVALNIDTGSLVAVEQGDQDVVAWIESELPYTDMAAVRKGFDMVRAIIRKHFDEAWKKVDWSFWKPGMRVTWAEAHPGLGNEVVEVDGRKFFLLDTYCITEECQCEDVIVSAIEIIDGEEAELPTLAATVVPSDPKSLKVVATAARDQALAKRIWATWVENNDPYAKLARRRDWMRTFGVELSRWRNRHAPVVQPRKLAPNQICPCGSGKKYKRCCGRKIL